jgi:8-oxo-dGTP pyrophosphatase MutT (NUDIX family)
MARHAADGPLALVSSDIPGIPQGSLRRAFAALDEGADIVLGPALDGGYWLVAMREFSEAPFRSIPWSTPAVYAVTVRRCEQAGLRIAALETWRDVDTPVDLAFLARSADELPAPRTRELLRELEPTPAPPEVRLDSSQFVAGSPWRCVIEDRLLTDDGAYSGYTYLAVPRMVFVVPVTDAGQLLLLRRYRHPVRDWTLEVPAGTVDDGETAREAAERELAEELGATAANWHHLALFYPCGSHVGLRADAFLATGVVPDDLGGGDLVALPLAEALALAEAGALRDGQSAVAILLARSRLEGR